MTKIQDGTGSGNLMKVDSANRAHSLAVTKSEQNSATERADSYNINSGLVTLTDATEQGILYLKNNEDRDFIITAFVAIMGPSTGGLSTDTTHIRMYKNPTTGTLISEAVASDIKSNRNFGSSLTLDADCFKGDGSATVTDGGVHIESLINPGNRAFFGIDEILTKGDSVAFTFEPNDSNTSMKCMCAIIGYLHDPSE